MMDYGFAPGGTSFDIAARNYLEWRPDSKSVFTLDPTVESFVAELQTSNLIDRPVRDLGIGCHGHWTGALEIQLDSASPTTTRYKDVASVAASGSIRIPSTVLDPRPMLGGVEVKPVVRIVGCQIGTAAPFLQSLKQALGGDLTVIATQHYDSATELPFGDLTGILRCLLYDFRILRLEAFDSRAQALEAFEKKKFKMFDGITDVPSSIWEEVIPAEVEKVGEVKIRRRIDIIVPGYYGGATLFPTIPIWDHQIAAVGPFPVTGLSPISPISDDYRAFMRDQLHAVGELQPWHPFPLYVQKGYASFDAFIDGYDWRPTDNTATVWAGFRHVYHVRIPIWQPPNPYHVVCDYVSKDGTVQYLGLPDTDSRFFTIV